MLYPQQTKVLAEKWRAFSSAPYRVDIYAEIQRANKWIRIKFQTPAGVIPMLNVHDGYFEEVRGRGIRTISIEYYLYQYSRVQKICARAS